MESFRIVVELSGNRVYRMEVTRKLVNASIERYEVRAKNHCFVMDCNRPVLQKNAEAHLPWEWNLIAGQCPDYFLREIQQAIRKTVCWMEAMSREGKRS